ncbi:GTPase activating protein [Grosmannia clavigera kw1407]|uniref:GTPase activating protein n=1 Tax=Grosmannia clavigera (strain kw1407 / UAMH 11150) TaxID=655863 RepID=F0XAF7_GROCL|nr:GTPase activating protein [Grosmannia clavigera kw1407]EFX06070.1 GTPase activating protein [Grosmannia clavigera kw1407]
MESDGNGKPQRISVTEHEPTSPTVAEMPALEPESLPEDTSVLDVSDAQDGTPTELDGADESLISGESQVAVDADSDPDTVLVDNTAATAADEEDMRRLDEHDSLVTVRLSEPPVLTIDTSAAEQSDDEPSTPAATPSIRTAMPTLCEADESDDSVDPDVNWEQLQRTEDEECSGKGTENTAMLLARLEQENAKLATNPKSVKVYGPEPQQQQTPRRPRPPSMAQLRDMINGPTPPALRYSMLPPPPLTDLEFYAALVQDYHQTAARLPTLLANKIRKGIPPPLRGVVWQGMTDARDEELGSRFDRFCVATSPYEGLIGKDLGRSFPGVEMFRDPDGDGQRMLGRVLKSYSLHDRRIGYCQGLAFLVGPLLMHMPDKEAFCVLVKLMENYDLRSSYTPDLAGLHVRIYQFRELLRAVLPELSAHLDELQVDPAGYVSQWFLSFFAVTCPLPMLFRMFDVVFAEGAAETIMRVALSIMQKNEERLLACAELEDAIQLLLSRGLWDCYHYNADEFVQHFLGLSSVVTRDRLALLEQAYRKAQVTNTNQTGNANVDRTSAIATAASRFLGRLWVSSSSSFSLSSPPTATSATFPSSFRSSGASSPNTSDPSSSASPSASNGLSLSAAPLRPLSMLRRSTSKQSLASTVNSMEAASTSAATSSTSSTASSSSSVLSTASTEATSMSRDSANSTKANTSNGARIVSSILSKPPDNERYLNSQIEDLLTALSDLQRQHAVLVDRLQNDREDRDEDRKAVRALLHTLREKTTTQSPPPGSSEEEEGDISDEQEGTEKPTASTRRTALPTDFNCIISCEELTALLEPVDARFPSDSEDCQAPAQQTKAQLRDELARAKEQLAHEVEKGREHSRREYDLEQEVSTAKEQLRDSHAHVRSLHQDKQRLERLIHDMRTRAASTSSAGAGAGATQNEKGAGDRISGGADAAGEWFGRATGPTTLSGRISSSGLREFKLSRSKSTPSQVSASYVPSLPVGNGGAQRASSLTVRGESVYGSSNIRPNSGSIDQQSDALVLELVQAKTAEAVARQEVEESRQKFDSLRKALGLSPADMTAMLQHAGNRGSSIMASTATNTATAAAMNMLGRHATAPVESGNKSPTTATAPTATAAPSGYGGFFGWRRQ